MKYFFDASLSVKFSMVYVRKMHLVCPTTFPDFVTNCFFQQKEKKKNKIKLATGYYTKSNSTYNNTA